MDTIPKEWVDKIFNYMNEYFGERWANSFKYQNQLEIYKSQWQTGLTGLTREEIKSSLFVSRNLARNNQNPPNVIEFYHYGKGIKPPPKPVPQTKITSSHGIARNSIDAIKKIIKREYN